MALSDAFSYAYPLYERFLRSAVDAYDQFFDVNCETACIDGQRIYFSSDFLEHLNDREHDFVMMYEIMHVVLEVLQTSGKTRSDAV